MTVERHRRLFIAPAALRGWHGGPGTFARLLAESVSKQGVEVRWGLSGRPGRGDTVLVVNGTRDLFGLWRAKRRGARIVQRLGLPPTVFDYLGLGFGERFKFKAREALTRSITYRFADHLVFQSNFCRRAWRLNKNSPDDSTILNGTDLQQFAYTNGQDERTELIIVSAEGTQGSDPFHTATQLAAELVSRGVTHRMVLAGPISPLSKLVSPAPSSVELVGRLTRDELARVLSRSTVYLLTDVVSACPNSLIEALASGVPGLAYDYGAAPELIGPDAGILVPVENDPATGAHPGNIGLLADAVLQIAERYSTYSKAARLRAEALLGVDRMTDQYMRVLFPVA